MEECCRDEEWENIPGVGNMYEVSTCGRVKSLYGRGRILKQTETSAGTGKYLGVGLITRGKPKTYRVHRLVAEVFLSNPEDKPMVLHGDSDRYNNHRDNLRWGTRADNLIDDCQEGKFRDWKAVREQAMERQGEPILVRNVNQPVASTINSGKKSGFGPKGSYSAWTKNTVRRNGSYYGDMYLVYNGGEI